MKTRFILIAALLASFNAAPSPAGDLTPDTRVRGLSFLPRAEREIAGTVRIDVPRSCAREDAAHAKEKYPMAFFTAGCGGANPCLTLSIMVMIIPESIRGFDEVVKRSQEEDFGPGDVRKINEALIANPGSGADRLSLHYGPSYLAGSHIIGCFHSAAKKKTSKVVIGLTYFDSLTDGEWQVVLVNSVNILKSLKFMK